MSLDLVWDGGVAAVFSNARQQRREDSSLLLRSTSLGANLPFRLAFGSLGSAVLSMSGLASFVSTGSSRVFGGFRSVCTARL